MNVKKIIVLIFFVFTTGFLHSQNKIHSYLLTQFNQTLYDVTYGNNIWGLGLSGFAIYDCKTKIKPVIEVNTSFIFLDDKVGRMDSSDNLIESVTGISSVLAGAMLTPTKSTYISVVAGPSFLNGKMLMTLKPSVGFYFPKNKRFTAKFAFTNVYNRYKPTKEDFGSLNIALGFRLF